MKDGDILISQLKLQQAVDKRNHLFKVFMLLISSRKVERLEAVDFGRN